MTPPFPGRPVHAAALEATGATEHFADPAWYAAIYADRHHDVAFYVARAAGVGRVLELGCGEGRITRALARAGVSVTAVDRSPAMIDALNAAKEPGTARVDATVADLRTYDPGGVRFPLVICPFNTFLHLYTRDDVARALSVVKRSLAPGGHFVFDTSVPRAGDLRDHRARGRRVRRGDRRWTYVEDFLYEPLEQILYVTMTWSPDDGGDAVRQILAHRQFFPAELEALLDANGFTVARATEWGAPLSRDPDAIVWECALR